MKLPTRRKDKKADKETSTPALKYDTIATEEGVFQTTLTRKYLNRKSYAPLNIKHVISAIPGTVTKLMVAEGDEVTEGDILLELEAMKMHNKILAPMTGKIKAINVKEGERIPKNFLMVEFE